MPILKGLKGLATFTGASAALFAGTWKLYTHNTTFVPFDSTTASFLTLSNPLRSRNPNNNPPALQDHCQRRVPLSKLQTTDQEELTRRFCAGVWSGWGFEYQRKKLEKEGRALEGRAEHLWDREVLGMSGYEVGTKIADHFEVVERTPGRVVVRCGDTPAKQGLRPSDGLFSMEVDVDKNEGYATFHMKSFFFNSTPEGKTAGVLPWYFPFLHREYAKLWMETSVRKLLK